MTETIFGPLVSTWTLQQQIVETYRVWLNEYLAAVERAEGLKKGILTRPPAPESFHGGLDFDSWVADELPKVIVVVEPTGKPELAASGDFTENEHHFQEGRGGYSQWYEVQVGSIVRALGAGNIAKPSPEPEDEARALAAYYGAASMLLVDRPPALASEIHMVQSPTLSYPSPDERTVVRARTAFYVNVSAIKLLAAGPVSELPSESPYYEAPEEPWKKEVVATTLKVSVGDTEPI